MPSLNKPELFFKNVKFSSLTEIPSRNDRRNQKLIIIMPHLNKNLRLFNLNFCVKFEDNAVVQILSNCGIDASN